MQIKKEKVHNDLGSKQLQILRFLAENGPHTINATNTKLFSLSHYHGTHTAFKSLEKKGLIKKLNPSSIQYWLTEKGVIYALAREMNPQKLFVHTENVYGKNSLMALLVKLAQALGPKAYRFCSNLMLDKGLTEESVSIALNTSLIYASQLSGKNPQTLMKEILTVLKDFPEFYSLYRQTFEGIKKGILNLSEIVEGVNSECP